MRTTYPRSASWREACIVPPLRMVPSHDRPAALADVDRYTVERLLGSGAMGNVYLAYDTRLRRRVALKVLDAHVGAMGVDSIAATMREARAAGAIAHPNAAAIFDAEEVNGGAYIVMEYVPGTALRRFIGDPSVAIPTRIRWLVDIAGALAAAHAVGVVHRDVKPENVLIRDDGMVKVLDFGIARIGEGADEALRAQSGPHMTWTQDGGFVGTPGYMAPEILRGQQADGRADQFGWGVLAYELLAGRLPWKRVDGAMGVIASVLTQEPDPLGPEVPPAVAAVVARALSKAREDRFPSIAHAALLIADLAVAAPFHTPVAASPRPPPVPPPRAPLPSAPELSEPRLPWGTLSSASLGPSRPRFDSRLDDAPISPTPPPPARLDPRVEGTPPPPPPTLSRRSPPSPFRPHDARVDPRVEDTPSAPRRAPTSPWRPADSRPVDPPSASRRAPTSPFRPHDPYADETPTPPPTSLGRRPPAFPPPRTFDDPPSSTGLGRRTPAPPRPFDPRAEPQAGAGASTRRTPIFPPPPRETDAPPSSPAEERMRRKLDSSPDSQPSYPGFPRRKLDSRPDESPVPTPMRRAFSIGFHRPDFLAPVDLQAHIALLPPAATCKGMFFNDLFHFAARRHTQTELALLAGIPDRRYVAFRDYPVRDNMRLTVAVAATMYPRLALGEALRRIGQRALALVLDSHVGRTLFGVLPADPEPYLLEGPKAYRMLAGVGEVTAEQLSPTSFRLHASDMPLFLETYQIGVLESVLNHCGARADIEISMASLATATVCLKLR